MSLKSKHTSRMKKVDKDTKNLTNEQKYYHAIDYIENIISVSISDNDKKKHMVPSRGELGNSTDYEKAMNLVELFTKFDEDLIKPYQEDLKNLTPKQREELPLTGDRIRAAKISKEYKVYKKRLVKEISLYQSKINEKVLENINQDNGKEPVQEQLDTGLLTIVPSKDYIGKKNIKNVTSRLEELNKPTEPIEKKGSKNDNKKKFVFKL